MSSATLANRMISTTRNIRQRCQLKYSRYGTFSWDKWIEYDCIFSSIIHTDGTQHCQLELHSHNNIHDPNGKRINLEQLQSLTCEHGNMNKNEPRDIIKLKIAGKKHRLGFDNVYEYNQWKCLLDGVFNSSWDAAIKDSPNDNQAINMLYESATAMRYRVKFADLATQQILALPNGDCELIFDIDKLVLEQHRDKQYTFPRSTIRGLSLVQDNEIEFELGTLAPVQGFIRFLFETPLDARSCYLQWNEAMTTVGSSRQLKERHSVRTVPQQTTELILPPRMPTQHNNHPPRPPPRSHSTKSPYYNTESSLSSQSPLNAGQSEYSAFHTLV